METRETREIKFHGLPLTVYREIVAHLQQVEGIIVGLIPQSNQQFDYRDSQIAGVWIDLAPSTDGETQQRVEQILAYYQNRYGV